MRPLARENLSTAAARVLTEASRCSLSSDCVRPSCFRASRRAWQRQQQGVRGQQQKG
jgi:hypothetical protein